MDDGATLARSDEHATDILNSIARQDPDGRLEWDREVDYPISQHPDTCRRRWHCSFEVLSQEAEEEHYSSLPVTSLIPDESTSDLTVL